MRVLLLLLALLLAWPSSASAQDASMSFRVAKDGEANAFSNAGYDVIVFAEGDIQLDTPERAERFFEFIDLGRFPKRLIMLNSGGGNLAGGMNLARTIRKHRIDTALKGNCESACVSAYAGGVWRYYGYSHALNGQDRLKVHRFTGLGADLGETLAQEISGEWINFFIEMGIDPLLFTISAQFEKTTPIPLELAIDLKLANEGDGPVENRTYLKDKKIIFEVSRASFHGRASMKTICDLRERSQPLSISVDATVEVLIAQGMDGLSSPVEATMLKGTVTARPRSDNVFPLTQPAAFEIRKDEERSYPDGVRYKQIEFGGPLNAELIEKMRKLKKLEVSLFYKTKYTFSSTPLLGLEKLGIEEELKEFVNECSEPSRISY